MGYLNEVIQGFGIEKMCNNAKENNNWIISTIEHTRLNKPIMRQLGVYQIKSRKEKWKQNK